MTKKTGDSKRSTPPKHSSYSRIINPEANDSPNTILYLQRAIGNQALQRLVRPNNNNDAVREFDFAKIGILQPKLKISQPGDAYEQEADKVAEQVMTFRDLSDSVKPIMTANHEGLDRKCPACEMKDKDKQDLNISRKPLNVSDLEANDQVTNEVNNVRCGGGSSLDSSTKEFMESRFGYDFSSVRIHTGTMAGRSSNSVNALAYTVGNDITFGEGQHQPNTLEGRRLIAHELTHVLQQSGSDRSRVGRGNGKRGPSSLSLSVPEERAVAGNIQRDPADLNDDKPQDVLEAIVHIMAGDLGDNGENLAHPLYYINVKKNVTDKKYVSLLWKWFQITVIDNESMQPIVQGSKARTHIASAVLETVPLVNTVILAGGGKSRLVNRYHAKLDELNQRAAREEALETVEAGMKREHKPWWLPDIYRKDEELQIYRDAILASDLLKATVKTLQRATTHEATFRFDIGEWIDDIDPEGKYTIVSSRAAKMNLADGIAWLKGGLEGVTAVLTVADPENRRKLFEQHSDVLGKLLQGADLLKLLSQFVSGAITFAGASAYGSARLLGHADLAAKVLKASTNYLWHAGAALNFIGVIHGTLVMIDPDSSSNEKIAAGIEIASGAVGFWAYLARFSSSLVPEALGGEAFLRLANPISASLWINYFQFKYLADKRHRFEIALNRLDWASCAKATKAAAEKVRESALLLAVTDAQMANQPDALILSELRKYADAFRWDLVEMNIKPYIESKKQLRPTSGGRYWEDPDICGPGLTKRFEPLFPLLGQDIKTNGEAFQAAAKFLMIVSNAFAEWDMIVEEGWVVKPTVEKPTVEPLPRSTLDVWKHEDDRRAKIEAEIIQQLRIPMKGEDPRAIARSRLLVNLFSKLGLWAELYYERINLRRSDDELVNLLYSRISLETRARIFKVLGIEQISRMRK